MFYNLTTKNVSKLGQLTIPRQMLRDCNIEIGTRLYYKDDGDEGVLLSPSRSYLGTSKVSQKGQVVIPTNVLKKLGTKRGVLGTISIAKTKENEICFFNFKETISSMSALMSLIFKMDTDKYLIVDPDHRYGYFEKELIKRNLDVLRIRSKYKHSPVELKERKEIPKEWLEDGVRLLLRDM